MNTVPLGRSLELFFIEGKPDGMQTAEVFNWTGHVLMTPRTRLVNALKRREAQHSGIYILLGDDAKSGDPTLYVGESENIAERIRNHDTKKDWWIQAVFITTAADVLHKAHIKYLEARLIEIAKRVGRVTLDNSTAPEAKGLTEAALVNMEVFLDTLLMVLPALRIDCFLEQTRSSVEQTSQRVSDQETPVFELVSSNSGVDATAILEDGELVVQAGSCARGKWVGNATTEHHYANLYRELVRTGVLAPDGEHTVFTKNYAFKSTSAAGAVINGRPTAGPVAWKLKGADKTYKEWERETLAAEENMQ